MARLRIFNPDGSEAELSGNGAREAILYLRRRGWTDADTFSIQTAAGEIRPTITGPTPAASTWAARGCARPTIPAGGADGAASWRPAGATWRFQHVSIGNPQCAIRVADRAELEALDLPALGPAIERHELFPNRTNVSWYAELEPGAHPRADLRARGGGDDVLGHRRHAAPPSPTSLRGGDVARDRASSTAASSRSRSGRTCTST